MTHQQIADDLLFPLWRCVDAEFKSKYRADAWGMFENFLKSAAYCENLRAFLDKFKRLMPLNWQHQFERIVFLCESDASDKDVRALALSMAKRQLEEQKTRMKKVRKDLKACHTS